MRDNSDDMIEIIAAVQKNGSYFIIISVTKLSEKAQFSFEVTATAYKAVRRILQSRPLGTFTGMKYYYFWTGSIRKTAQKTLIRVRCEVNQQGKSFDFLIPHTLAANLKWFSQIKTLSEATDYKVKIF